nr:MAG TPA: hypothetical protein [Caudoviricetes sp.]
MMPLGPSRTAFISTAGRGNSLPCPNTFHE